MYRILLIEDDFALAQIMKKTNRAVGQRGSADHRLSKRHAYLYRISSPFGSGGHHAAILQRIPLVQ